VIEEEQDRQMEYWTARQRMGKVHLRRERLMILKNCLSRLNLIKKKRIKD
jgi:hypothetical protein